MKLTKSERMEAPILAWPTKRKPADGSTHWSSRKLDAELGGDLPHLNVAPIRAQHTGSSRIGSKGTSLQ